VDAAQRILLAQVGDHLLGEGADIDDFTVQRVPRNPRQRQQRIDQLGHLFDAVLDAQQAAPLIVGDVRAHR
jgi:hypothetical protein